MDHADLFRRAFERRAPLFDLNDTDCFRLVNGDRDGLDGCAVDRYGPWLLLHIFRDALVAREDELVDALSAAARDLPLDVQGILVKRRLKGREGDDRSAAARSRLAAGLPPPERVIVRQNGLKAAADLVQGQNTGVFLDMREVRRELAGHLGPGHRVLNLFSYTALFSVQALSSGAARAVNVDLSRTVLRRARDNYALNDLAADDRDFIQGDALEWIRRFRRRGDHFTHVIYDPPTFSRNRHRSYSVHRDYAAHLDLLRELAPDGYLLTSVNAHGVSPDEYRSWHPAWCEALFLAHESSDFLPGGDPYLKVGFWRVKNS